jgi:hypothetical protein
VNLLTFLGVANYAETTYILRDQRHTTRYCGAALAHFLKPERTLVVVTNKAHGMHFETLADELCAVTQPEAVRIPDGSQEGELWEIFDALTGQVSQGSELIADITNGFRSLPFLSFLAVAYLRAAKQVRVPAVYYGAYEARTEQNESPVFDLTPFVGLLDWLTATDQFNKTGNALSLARLLNDAGRPALSDLAAIVGDISLGLRLLRPRDTSAAACRLADSLRAAETELPRPFAVLADSVGGSYGRFGLPDDADPQAHLVRQLRMIGWYHERGQIVHCLSMAREWVISLLCYHFHLDAWSHCDRAAMEFLIGGGKRKDPQGNVVEQSPYLDQWATIPGAERLRALWLKEPCLLREVRNDVLHSGFRNDARPAAEILDATRMVVEELQSIARTWGMSEGDTG